MKLFRLLGYARRITGGPKVGIGTLKYTYNGRALSYQPSCQDIAHANGLELPMALRSLGIYTFETTWYCSHLFYTVPVRAGGGQSVGCPRLSFSILP